MTTSVNASKTEQPAGSSSLGLRNVFYSIAFVILSASFCQGQDYSHCQLTYSKEIFETKLGAVTLHHLTASQSRHQTVLMIHGSAGLYSQLELGPREPDNFGEKAIACAGYDIYLPQYFDVSGVRSANDREFIRSQFQRWLDALIQIAYFLREKEKHRIVVVAESLGGYLALMLAASTHDVCALSLYSSGVPETFKTPLHDFPPTLIQHGKLDTVIQVDEAYKLHSILNDAGTHNELIVWQDLAHDLSTNSKHPASATLKFLEANTTYCKIEGRGKP
jgi:alpha-beta hydrolase superfamily lysophospholipase